MSRLWTEQQHEILHALGYQVLTWSAGESEQIPYDDRLFQAIVKAAGQGLESAEAIFAHCSALQDVRKSPQAKKTLWPVLRHMRA